MDTIYLINLTSDRIIHPLGLLYVGSPLKKEGYSVKIIHTTFDEIPRKTQEILSESPLFVGFTVLTGKHVAFAAEFSREIKRGNSKIPIIWGGVHPSLLPDQCLKDDFVDIVVIGEGEKTIVEIAKVIKNSGDLKNVYGIGFKDKNGKFVITKPNDFINLDDIQISWELVDFSEWCFVDYTTQRKVVDFITSRGCTYNCGFCYNKAFNKRRWRTHSIEFVVENLKMLKKDYGINQISFCDDNFCTDIDRAIKIVELLNEIDIMSSYLQFRIPSLNENLLKQLQKLGTKRILLGIESGSNRILELINKGITRELVIEKMKLLSKFPDISVNAAMIIGYPTESMKEIEMTIDLGIEISRLVPSAVVTLQTYLPFPGSDLYNLAIKEGFIPPNRNSGWGVFDAFDNRDMNLTWLPWADRNTIELFYRMDKYSKLLTHSPSDMWYRTIAKKIFYLAARERLKRRFFSFPFELYFQNKFNRYFNPDCKI